MRILDPPTIFLATLGCKPEELVVKSDTVGFSNLDPITDYKALVVLCGAGACYEFSDLNEIALDRNAWSFGQRYQTWRQSKAVRLELRFF